MLTNDGKLWLKKIADFDSDLRYIAELQARDIDKANEKALINMGIKGVVGYALYKYLKNKGRSYSQEAERLAKARTIMGRLKNITHIV